MPTRRIQCVMCRKPIEEKDELIMLSTKWGPVHCGCGTLLSHSDKYSGERLPEKLRTDIPKPILHEDPPATKPNVVYDRASGLTIVATAIVVALVSFALGVMANRIYVLAKAEFPSTIQHYYPSNQKPY